MRPHRAMRAKTFQWKQSGKLMPVLKGTDHSKLIFNGRRGCGGRWEAVVLSQAEAGHLSSQLSVTVV